MFGLSMLNVWVLLEAGPNYSHGKKEFNPVSLPQPIAPLQQSFAPKGYMPLMVAFAGEKRKETGWRNCERD